MTEKNRKLYDMIKENQSLDTIKKELQLTEKQIYRRVRTLIETGIRIDRNFYIDGHYQYKTPEGSIPNYFELYTDSLKNEFLMISDTHFAHQLESIESLYACYEYAKDHHIHTIFHAGDLIAGEKKKHVWESLTNVLDQLDYVVNVYPQDPTIMNYIVFGNHDHISNSKIEIKNFLEHYRSDFVGLDFTTQLIKINHAWFRMNHMRKVKLQKEDYITFNGHFHHYGLTIENDKISCTVPTLSNISTSTIRTPSMLHVIFDETNQLSVEIKQIAFTPKPVVKVSAKIPIDAIDTYNQRLEKHYKIKKR